RFDDYDGPFARNHVYRLFAEPRRRRLYADYDAVAHNMVGLLRAHYADHVGDPRFEELVDALRAVSPEFTRLWDDRLTQPLETFALRLRHETLGLLALDAVRLSVDAAPDVLVFVGPPADAQTAAALAHALRRVRSANAGPSREKARR